MTSTLIEEHNRVFDEARALVLGEIIIQDGFQCNAGCRKSVRSKLERAIKLFSRVLEINPKNWSAMWLVGKVHQRLGDHCTALAWFKRSYEVNPSQADVAREASISAMYLGSSEEAIFYAYGALQSRPSDKGLRANLALAFLLAGRLDDAKVAIDNALAGNLIDPIATTLRAMIDHFIDSGHAPPNTTEALESYWKKR